VKPGVTGYVCATNEEFARRIQELQQSSEIRETMRVEARRHAESASWDRIFEAVYRAYSVALLRSEPLSSKLHLSDRANATAEP